MKLKNALACVAVASFTLAQPAAAATRSYESLPQSGIQQPAAADRAGTVVNGSEQFAGGIGAGLLILLIAGVLAALIAAGGGFGHGKDSTG